MKEFYQKINLKNDILSSRFLVVDREREREREWTTLQ